MAFPDVIVECAFDNDVNEFKYAQAGYSDITQFVKSMSGTLRGRAYEMDNVETGSLSITLDNSDGRFTPGKVASPYYPNVKPSRRLRVRGRNLQRSQIATAGSTLRSTEGFARDTYPSHLSSYPTDPVLVESRVSGVSPLFTKRKNLATVRAPAVLGNATITPNVEYGGNVYSRVTVTTSGHGVRELLDLSDLVNGHTYTATWELANDGLTAVTVGLDFCDQPSAGGVGHTLQPGEVGRFSVTASKATYDSTYRFADLSVVGAGNSILYRAISVYDGTDTDYFDGDTESILRSDGTAADYRWTGTPGASTSEELNHAIGAGTHHIEVTVPSGTPAGAHGLVQFNVPLELGRRLYHSVYMWRVSGTEPAGTAGVSFVYFDADGNALTPYAGNGWALPTPSTPTRRVSYGGHTPPPTAASCMALISVSATAAFTTSVTYAFDAIQTEDTPNLAPNPYGRWDAKDWYVTGDSDTTPTNGPMYIQMVAAADGADYELYTLIGGLVPGETYTAAVELFHENSTSGGTPTTNLQITADGGQTTTVVGAKAVWETGVYTFEAVDTVQKLVFQLENGDSFPAGHVVQVRRLNVQPGDTSPGLYSENGASDITDWEHPKPIFEGWVENWPVRASSDEVNEITVVANDRLKRIGDITLDSTWREAVFADSMELIIPFDDDPVDASGRVAQIGTWASSDQIIDVPLLSTKGDLGNASYTLGVDGPATPTAIDFNAVSELQGYFVQMDYSKDYVAPAAPPPPPPPTYTPPPPAPTYTTKTYKKTYYATWSRSFDGDNSVTWDDSAYCYQGYFDGNRGLTRSLVGFNYRTIMSDLSGATIESCYFTARNEHAYYYSGMTAYLGTHSYSSKPSSWSGGSVHENRWHVSWDYGKSRSVSLGVTVGNEFKAGTSRGISFGPPPYGLAYYGYFRGATLSYRPYLTITYSVKVRVS